MLDKNTENKINEWVEAADGIVSVSVRNIRNAFDYSLNDKVRMGAASTIKVPLIVETLSQVRDGILSLDQVFQIADEMCCPGSGVITHLHSGTALTLKDLLTLMLIVSDNTATNVIIDLVGSHRKQNESVADIVDSTHSMSSKMLQASLNVSDTLKSLGFTQTALKRKMYDWGGIKDGIENYITAREMAELFVLIAQGKAVGDGYDKLIIDILCNQMFQDGLSLFLPDGVKFANKPGECDDVVHDCGIIMTSKFSYSIALCTQPAGNHGESKVLMGRISKAIYDCVSAANPSF